MGHSTEDWKRVPSAAAALFAIDLPYCPPKNPIAAFLWRRRLWIEVTCGLSLLEPWEKVITLAIFYLLLTLVVTAVFQFMPQQAPRLYHRSRYYLFGSEGGVSVPASTGVRRLVIGWAGEQVVGER
ncbi:hypothetical protein C8Q76DRAFT_317879 [Earliella scabrosa]|nr:hypothetical protein C8Q76DRAFT_317879 [Earliella scabrosa]